VVISKLNIWLDKKTNLIMGLQALYENPLAPGVIEGKKMVGLPAQQGDVKMESVVFQRGDYLASISASVTKAGELEALSFGSRKGQMIAIGKESKGSSKAQINATPVEYIINVTGAISIRKDSKGQVLTSALCSMTCEILANAQTNSTTSLGGGKK
jgi:hypothetical protein